MNKVNTLCLIDDDDIFQFLTESVIKETNLVNQIRVFSNGRDALDFLRSEANNPDRLPEIILLDLTMPVMDGWEFLEEYILLQPRLGKKIVIYVVSSSIAPVDVQKAKSISAVTDYVIKPVTKDKFIDLIINL